MSARRSTGDTLARICEEQGFKVKCTRNGWTVYGKGGTGTVGFHKTPSDHRAYRNTVADLRRIGVHL